MKNILKDILFLLIFFVLLFFCTNIFVLKGNGYGSDVTSFYHQKRNSLDVIFFGSSHSYSTFSPEVIEKETGLKSYNFATQQQPIYITYHYMIEALKTQKPKYFILETKMLADESEYTSEGVVRDALDKMKFSYNKHQAIQASVEKDKKYYYLNLIKYHSRYKELNKNDIVDGILRKGIDNLGFIALPSNEEIMIHNEEILKVHKTEKIASKQLNYFNKIIALAKKYNIQLILVKTPCILSEKEQLYYNWVKEYAKENHIQYIDYNQIDLSLENGDFFDFGHLSEKGAIKVSKHFSTYLVDK